MTARLLCSVARAAALIALATVTLAAHLAAPAAAATFLRAQATGHQVVPPNASPAFGSSFLEFDDTSRQLTVNMTVGGLTGTLLGARINGPALPGATGPLLFTVSTSAPFTTVTLTPAQAAELLAGLWYLTVASSAFPEGEVRGQIAEALPFPAVLPNSRAVQVGQPATAFASIVNSGIDAVGCGIALATPIPASFKYQTTNPATNLVTGSPDTPVSIRGGGSQSFALFLVPTAPFPPTEVRFTFDCANSPPAPVTVGLDTLLLSASASPVPDVVAVAQAPTSPSGFFIPGILALPRPSRQGAFVVAASNVGATGALTVSADTGEFPFPLTVSLCRTNLATADCETPAAASVTTTMATSAAAGFAVFVTSPGDVPLLPAVRRLFIRFRDAGGVIRGSTSIAVTTPFF